MFRLTAFLLALAFPGLPLVRSAAITGDAPCAMHQAAAAKRPGCHEARSAKNHSSSKRCCKASFAKGSCTCGHGDEASGAARDPSLPPPEGGFAVAVDETFFPVRTADVMSRLHDAPESPPPIVSS